MSTPIMIADVYEALADTIPDLPAVIQGNRRLTWSQYDNRAACLASVLAAHGIGAGQQIGMYLYNSPEYLETQYAAFKNRVCAVNVNYRYLDDELAYLLENADCAAVIFHGGLADRVARVAAKLPLLKLLIQVDDPQAPDVPLIEGAIRYEDAINAHLPAERIERQPDDLYMLYTGGTTGMPKGVMSPVGVIAPVFLSISTTQMGRPPFADVADVVATVSAMASAGIQFKAMPCCPLMHGTGIWLGAFTAQLMGGAVVLLESRNLDPIELFDTVERERVNTMVIVGDAFARPMVNALCNGKSWDLSSLLAVISSGAMFSQEVKAALLEFVPQASIIDTLGSSEGAMGTSVSTKDGASDTAKFSLVDNVKVIDDDGNEVKPGSGVVGRVASPAFAIGYYKDPEKTSRTFTTIDGSPYSLPGDMAMIEADGSLTLLGRGSHCINTAGEKVFPEEVEETVKRHPSIADCLVFGVPDDRFGQRVVGVASLASGSTDTPDEVIAATKLVLSSFKVPRQLLFVDEVPRAPNGKADYASAKTLFETIQPG
jgi:3-oxocholest-4-en-26-oate---CoA ligase